LSALLAALASGLLLLLAGFLLATATLLTALTRLLFLLTGLLTTATLLAALTWILISHDLVSPAGKFLQFLQRTTFIPQVRSCQRSCEPRFIGRTHGRTDHPCDVQIFLPTGAVRMTEVKQT
jgi:hypothetical protein